MRKLVVSSLTALVAVLMIACSKSPGKTIVQKAADAMNKKDYAAFVALLSKGTVAQLNKGCDQMKRIPKSMVASVAKSAKMPEDLITHCTPAKIMEHGMKQAGPEKEKEFDAEKIKSETVDGNTIHLVLDDATQTKLTLVKEDGDWKIDLSKEMK